MGASKMSLKKLMRKNAKAETRLLRLQRKHDKTIMKILPPGKGLRKAYKANQKKKAKARKAGKLFKRYTKMKKKYKKQKKRGKLEKSDVSMLTKHSKQIVRKNEFKKAMKAAKPAKKRLSPE